MALYRGLGFEGDGIFGGGFGFGAAFGLNLSCI